MQDEFKALLGLLCEREGFYYKKWALWIGKEAFWRIWVSLVPQGFELQILLRLPCQQKWALSPWSVLHPLLADSTSKNYLVRGCQSLKIQPDQYWLHQDLDCYKSLDL